MIRLTDKALADIRADSEQGLPPGIGDTQLMVAEIAALRAECEGLRKVMACVVSEVPRYTHCDGNAPGHCHSVPGIWDSDNGAKAGTECGWCTVWNAAVAMSKEASNG
jgi:hypothetical protein